MHGEASLETQLPMERPYTKDTGHRLTFQAAFQLAHAMVASSPRDSPQLLYEYPAIDIYVHCDNQHVVISLSRAKMINDQVTSHIW